MTRPGLVSYAKAMKIVNIYEAKTHLSKLLEEVVAGKEIIIAKNGKPIADLKPHAPQKEIVFGLWKDKDVWISPDFDETDEELIKQMTEGPL